ncbi:MAG: ZIP family metal transporter [Thermoanaerobaculia bacterium]
MSTLGYILLFSFIGSIVSLVGGVVLLSREGFAEKLGSVLAPFAAGTLLGTAFLDLLPEAQRVSNGWNVFALTLAGIVVFFILERFVRWFHHHHEHTHEHGPEHVHADPCPPDEDSVTIPLIVFGDTVHNFIDGIVIAGTFLISIHLGIVTSIAVAAHEIPQEIGDFSILLHRGLSRTKVLVFNVVSALATMVGAVATYFIGKAVVGLMPIFISLTAGFFIYIASSDIIPEIHSHRRRGFALVETVALLGGIAAIWTAVAFLD